MHRPANIQADERPRHSITERHRQKKAALKLLLELQPSRTEPAELEQEKILAHDGGPIIGGSDALKQVLVQAQQVAQTDTAVLILGETGTGKELLAHALHSLSLRRDCPLIKVNCAALSPAVINDKLFGGEEQGCAEFSSSRVSTFDAAHGGTIFLDEIGELASELQAKLLRALEEGECARLESGRAIRVNARVIAASSRDLEESVERGRFRANLYYRLNAFPIRLPALRERGDDIVLLAKFFVGQISQRLGKRVETIPLDVQEALKSYSWPGNVQELKNVIERAVIITQGSELRLLDSLHQPGKAVEH